MGIVRVSRRLTGSRASSSADTGDITLTETYDVKTDSINDGQAEVLSADDLPGVGSLHWSELSATLRSYSNVQRLTQFDWSVDLEYSNEVSDKGNNPDDPLQWTIQWGLSFETTLLELEEDKQDTSPRTLVQNTANDWFDPQPTVPKYWPVLSVKRNVSTLSLMTVTDTVNKVNDGLFLSQPARTVLCRSIAANGPHNFRNSAGALIEYAEVTYEFLLDADLHQITILSQGYNELVGGVKTAIKDSDNRNVTRPQNLNAAGVATTDPDQVAELTFNKFEKADFSIFNLTISDLTGLGP